MSVPVLVITVIFSTLAFLAIVYFAVGFFLAKYLSKPKRFDAEYCHKIDVEKGLIPENIPELKREPLNIISFDGELIHGDYSPAPNSRGVIITAHGYTWTREGNVKYARMFYNAGFSVYLFDERGHGKNTTKYTTMGYKEGKDVAAIVNYFRNMLGKNALIGLHGESLGAACVMMSLKETNEVDFAIEDCGYISLSKLLQHVIKPMHVPAFFLWGADISLRLFFHYSYKKVNPGEAAASSKVPMLIIHGDADNFIPLENGKEIYSLCSNHAKIEIFPGADHALSYQSDPERYTKIVNDFVDHIRKEK